MKILRVKAVLFDMDGVITDTMPYHYRAWRRTFRAEGISISKCEVYLREGQPGRRTISEIFAQQGLAFDPARARRILDRKERLFQAIVRPRFVSGARLFLKRVRQKKIRLALVTGTARHEVHRILPDEIFEMFDVVVTGTEVKKGKPHPEPYLLALKKLGIRARDALVIENAPFGIRSAKRAHVTCIALATSLARSYLKEADFVFSSYRDLRRKVCLTAPSVIR